MSESNNENFADMLEETLTRTDYFATGDKVKGTVVVISKEHVFVDINGKSEAVFEVGEFLEKDGSLSIKKGDTIEGYVVSTRGGEIMLTKSIGKGASNAEMLRVAYSNEIPVEGVLSSVTKGGYTVEISGVRCFCPFSQIDIKPVSEPESLLQKSFTFSILEFGEGGKNIVLSRRKLLENQQKEREEELKKSLSVDDTIEAVVKNIKNFGIFVDIGGVDAFVPRSELSWSRNTTPESFAAGQKIQTKVIQINWDEKQISLSIKALQPEPWKQVENIDEGNETNGTVVNIIKSGVFVELFPGVEGFIHISKLSYTKRVNKPEDVVSIGDTVTVKVIKINNEEKKISLELLTGEANPWQQESDSLINSVQICVIESIKPNGLHVRLPNGMAGFIPKSEVSAKKGSDIQKIYNTGSEIKSKVIEIDRASKNVTLSEKSAKAQEERNEFESYMNKEQSQNSSSLGSLFKNKFDEIQKKIDES